METRKSKMENRKNPSVILSEDFMILWLATGHENARRVGARASCPP
jgi:hypothetical protein